MDGNRDWGHVIVHSGFRCNSMGRPMLRVSLPPVLETARMKRDSVRGIQKTKHGVTSVVDSTFEDLFLGNPCHVMGDCVAVGEAIRARKCQEGLVSGEGRSYRGLSCPAT